VGKFEQTCLQDDFIGLDKFAGKTFGYCWAENEGENMVEKVRGTKRERERERERDTH
jgi:hypothetical protein